MRKIPSNKDIQKKFQMMEGLFNLAYMVKYHQIQLKNPSWAPQKIHEAVMDLIEKGCA